MKPGEEKVWLNEFPGCHPNPSPTNATTLTTNTCSNNNEEHNNHNNKEMLATSEMGNNTAGEQTRRSPLQVRFVDELNNCTEDTNLTLLEPSQWICTFSVF